jgi:hypothetical protein
MSEPLDLRHDLHGHAIEFACDQDRAWFESHPDESCYIREPVEHEWCISDADGRCVSVVDPPPGATFLVEVFMIGPRVRARRPIFVVFEDVTR